jgi:hypothetical protein
MCWCLCAWNPACPHLPASFSACFSRTTRRALFDEALSREYELGEEPTPNVAAQRAAACFVASYKFLGWTAIEGIALTITAVVFFAKHYWQYGIGLIVLGWLPFILALTVSTWALKKLSYVAWLQRSYYDISQLTQMHFRRIASEDRAGRGFVDLVIEAFQATELQVTGRVLAERDMTALARQWEEDIRRRGFTIWNGFNMEASASYFRGVNAN